MLIGLQKAVINSEPQNAVKSRKKKNQVRNDGGMGSLASFSGGIGGASFSSSGGVPHVSGPGERGGYPGGGGAGASKSSENSAYASGRGADGLVIVEEYS